MAHHESFKGLGPIEWPSVASADKADFLTETFAQARTIIESIPVPATAKAATTQRRARSHTDSAVPVTELNRALSQRQSGLAIQHSQTLLKEWKEIKVGAKENPLAINVYKLAGKDGKGNWFARRSVHDGLSFDRWKLGLEREFAETMKVQTGPGGGSIRGIGAERRVERLAVDDVGKLEVFQLSAQFPGPTTPRDFITLLLTSKTAGPHTPSGSKQPLRQYMIVSKPCIHPDCPPRQGYIRGQYESVEIIREIPSEKQPVKRARSSIDLTNEYSKEAQDAAESVGREALLRAARRSADDKDTAASNLTATSAPEKGANDSCEGQDDGLSDSPPAVEWIMVTRSDPGGSVPRFLIDKGTPGGIIGDAGKFLKWITTKELEDFTFDDNDAKGELATEQVEREVVENGHKALIQTLTPTLVPETTSGSIESIPNSNGLYGIIAGAIGAASSAVVTRLPNPFGSPTPATYGSSTPSIPEEEDDAALSDTSSIRSFTSALESSSRLDDQPPSSPTKDAEEVSQLSSENPSVSQSTDQQHEKELRKLQERHQKFHEKVARMQERLLSKQNEDREKDVMAMTKLREKHERDVAKQEEKYRKELRRIQEKREQEEKKAEERKRKAAEKEQRENLNMELQRVRKERDLALEQMGILKTQVGELQAQNTLLAAQLGKLGGLTRENSGWDSFSKARSRAGTGATTIAKENSMAKVAGAVPNGKES